MRVGDLGPNCFSGHDAAWIFAPRTDNHRDKCTNEGRKKYQASSPNMLAPLCRRSCSKEGRCDAKRRGLSDLAQDARQRDQSIDCVVGAFLGSRASAAVLRAPNPVPTKIEAVSGQEGYLAGSCLAGMGGLLGDRSVHMHVAPATTANFVNFCAFLCIRPSSPKPRQHRPVRLHPFGLLDAGGHLFWHMSPQCVRGLWAFFSMLCSNVPGA